MRIRPVRIGTRGSTLALAQAGLVARALAAQGRPHRIVVIETAGDRRAADTAWGEGAFVAAIEQALLDGRVDVAVHSAKDVPTAEDDRLRIVAYLPRADPRDALVVRARGARSIAALPGGAVVGTDSPRRAGFLRAARPDLVVRPLHGNVDTRLRRLDAGEADALVLAIAGLERLGRADRISAPLDAASMPPAPGQGAIAVQVRRNDAPMLAIGAALDDPRTRVAVRAERELLRATGGGCRSPVGALATWRGGRLRIEAAITDEAGTRVVAETIETEPETADTEARALGARLASEFAAGTSSRPADRASSRPADRASSGPAPAARPAVLVTRGAGQAHALAAALRAEGLEPLAVPAIEMSILAPNPELDEALLGARPGDWVIATSANAARAAAASVARIGLPGGVRWAAVGDATRRTLEAAGVAAAWTPARSDAAALAAELPVAPGNRVVWPRGSLADGTVATGLRARGATVVEVVAYRTVEAPPGSRDLLVAALARNPPPVAVLFASGSAVRGTLALASADLRPQVLQIPAICLGPQTAAVARDQGFQVAAVADARDARALAELAGRFVRDRPLGVLP